MHRYYIYVLRDPRTFRVRYVGRTSNLAQRYHVHLKKRGSTKKEQWIWSLRTMGLIPLMELVDTCKPSESHAYEGAYIQKFTTKACPLLISRAAPKKPGDERILIVPRKELRTGIPVLSKSGWHKLKSTELPTGGHMVLYGSRPSGLNTWLLHVGEGPFYAPMVNFPLALSY